MHKVEIEKSMKECLFEAFKNNAIITSDGLSATEFIHVCNHKAYYEDGGCLGYHSEAYELLNSQEWAHSHKWYIIGYLDEGEVKAIKKLREDLRVYESNRFERKLNEILGNNLGA